MISVDYIDEGLYGMTMTICVLGSFMTGDIVTGMFLFCAGLFALFMLVTKIQEHNIEIEKLKKKHYKELRRNHARVRQVR